MADAAGVVRRFYKAFLMDHFDTMGALVAEDCYWEVTGGSPLANAYEGRDEVVGLFRRLKELSEGTLRPDGPDTADVVSGEDHTILLELFRAERQGRSLESHEAWVMEVNDEGQIEAGFHYLFDARAFDAFWA